MEVVKAAYLTSDETMLDTQHYRHLHKPRIQMVHGGGEGHIPHLKWNHARQGYCMHWLHYGPIHAMSPWKGQFITRVASWTPDHRKWLFSAGNVGIWTPHSPVLIKIYADKRPLNQLTVKNLFFHSSSKHFAINTNVLFTKKQLIWVFEWIKSVHYWWSYILFAPEWKELTCMLDPLLYRWGFPPVVIRCVHWSMQRGVLQTWVTAQSPAIVMFLGLNTHLQILHYRVNTIPEH